MLNSIVWYDYCEHEVWMKRNVKYDTRETRPSYHSTLRNAPGLRERWCDCMCNGFSSHSCWGRFVQVLWFIRSFPLDMLCIQLLVLRRHFFQWVVNATGFFVNLRYYECRLHKCDLYSELVDCWWPDNREGSVHLCVKHTALVVLKVIFLQYLCLPIHHNRFQTRTSCSTTCTFLADRIANCFNSVFRSSIRAAQRYRKQSCDWTDIDKSASSAWVLKIVVKRLVFSRTGEYVLVLSELWFKVNKTNEHSS